MRRGSADSIRASGDKTPHQQAGYKTAICLPVTTKSVLAFREASIQHAMMPAGRFAPGALIAGLGTLLLLTVASSPPAEAHAIHDETPRIAIISAFAPELAILKRDLEDSSEVSVNGVTFTTGTLEGHDVVLFLSGNQCRQRGDDGAVGV